MSKFYFVGLLLLSIIGAAIGDVTYQLFVISFGVALIVEGVQK